MSILEHTEHYLHLPDMHYHCDEFQFIHVCRYCDEQMGCYYCEFNYNERHDCDVA